METQETINGGVYPELDQAHQERIVGLIHEYEVKHKQRLAKRRELRARRKGVGVPPGTPYRFFLPNTTAHSILAYLGQEGPKTRQEVQWALKQSETSINSQILRLLDYDLVERDHYGVYSIAERGDEALAQLHESKSYTRWLR